MVTLEASRLFSQLNRQELATLRQIVREQSYARDQEIFKEGAEGDGLYVLKEGLVEISALIGPGQRRVFSKIPPGDIFGEMAVLDDKPRSASAIAVEPTLVYFLPRNEFLHLMDQSPGMARCALREISRRLREFDHQYLREVFQAEGLAAIGRFAGSVVHDLRNPVHLIGLATETFCMASSTPETRQRAKEIIRQQIENIKELVDEILAVSQGSPSDIVLSPGSYATFLTELFDEVRSSPTLRSAKLEFQSPPPEALVHVNPRRLRRVFLNLLQNAATVTPEEGVISLRFHVTSTEVVSEIKDSGPGIAPEVADHLFSAFASYGKLHGTGLGLFICKRIIDEHHGWISARNEPGGGAVFAFGLPLAKPEAIQATGMSGK